MRVLEAEQTDRGVCLPSCRSSEQSSKNKTTRLTRGFVFASGNVIGRRGRAAENRTQRHGSFQRDFFNAGSMTPKTS